MFRLTLILSVISSFGIGQACADDLPELNALIVSGNQDSLLERLQANQWTDDQLGSALIAAAGVNDPKSVEILIRAGAPVDYEVLWRTPLWVAVAEGNVSAAERLLVHGADANYVGNFEWRPLHQSITEDHADLNMVSMLLRFGAEIDAKTNLGVTALHRASGFCQMGAVVLLVERGADVSLRDGKGRTAGERAAQSGCPEIPSTIQ